MRDFDVPALLTTFGNLIHSTHDIRIVVEPQRLTALLPASVRWRRSRYGDASTAESVLKAELEEVAKHVRRLPLSPALAGEIDRVKRNISLTSTSAAIVTVTRIVELRAHLRAELGLSRFYVLPAHLLHLMDAGKPLFGAEVNAKFLNAAQDIEASGRCLALGEWTAAVFHCMRVLEDGLRVLADYVGVTLPVELENWKNIIDRIEAAVRDQEKLPKSAAKSESLRLCSQAAVQFRYFKDAWRNHVSHSRASYDEQRATAVWNAVREFMQAMVEII